MLLLHQPSLLPEEKLIIQHKNKLKRFLSCKIYGMSVSGSSEDDLLPVKKMIPK